MFITTRKDTSLVRNKFIEGLFDVVARDFLQDDEMIILLPLEKWDDTSIIMSPFACSEIRKAESAGAVLDALLRKRKVLVVEGLTTQHQAEQPNWFT